MFKSLVNRSNEKTTKFWALSSTVVTSLKFSILAEVFSKSVVFKKQYYNNLEHA